MAIDASGPFVFCRTVAFAGAPRLEAQVHLAELMAATALAGVALPHFVPYAVCHLPAMALVFFGGIYGAQNLMDHVFISQDLGDQFGTECFRDMAVGAGSANACAIPVMNRLFILLEIRFHGVAGSAKVHFVGISKTHIESARKSNSSGKNESKNSKKFSAPHTPAQKADNRVILKTTDPFPSSSLLSGGWVISFYFLGEILRQAMKKSKNSHNINEIFAIYNIIKH